MGVLAISLGVAVFPLLTRYAARNDIVNLRDSINRALRLALMEGIATGAGLYILAGPIVKVIYARRNFSPADAAQAAFVLQMYVLGMWAYCSYQILARAFYSMKDTATPLKVSCALVVINLLMVVTMVWIPWLGAGAFGLSTTITFAINAVVLVYLLRKRLGLFGGRKILASVIRGIIASAVMSAVIYLLLGLMKDMRNWIVVVACVPAGAFVFVGTAWLLGSPLDYNEFLDAVDGALTQLQLDGVLQVAGLHPRFQFADTEADDLGNATNRSPYPTLHLLREESVDRAVEAIADPSAIFATNIETMTRLGSAGWARLQQDCADDARQPDGTGAPPAAA